MTLLTLTLLLVLVTVIGSLFFCLSSSGVSFFTKNIFYSTHSKHLHLDLFDYELTKFRSIDEFGSFSEIKLINENDLQLLESAFQADKHIIKYESLADSYSNTIFKTEFPKDKLPFGFNCGCYSFYAINEYSDDGGYLYQVFIFENRAYIYYLSR